MEESGVRNPPRGQCAAPPLGGRLPLRDAVADGLQSLWEILTRFPLLSEAFRSGFTFTLFTNPKGTSYRSRFLDSHEATMKHSFDVDFTVQVREQIRDEDPEFAQFYQGIYSMALNTFVHIMFIPYFLQEVKDWSLRIPDDIDEVHSKQEARLFTAALSDYIVMPDEFRAGQEQLIPLPSPLPPYPDTGPREGVIFYVTPQQFARFSRELAEIEQLAFGIYATVRVSKILHLECIKFINENVMRSEHFSQKSLTMLGRHKQMLNGLLTDHFSSVSRTPIYAREMSPSNGNRQRESKQSDLARLVETSRR